MVEIPFYQNYGWTTGTRTCAPYEGKKPLKANLGENCMNGILKNSTSQDISERIHEPSTFDAVDTSEIITKERRLNSIFEICLEPRGLSECLSLTSPKNFVVQYFTVSRNHLVKSCSKSQCPFAAGQGLRKQESRQQPACPEIPRYKGRQIATQDHFSSCADRSIELHDAPADSRTCSEKITKSDHSHQDYLPCSNSREDCSSVFSSDSGCTARTFVVKSLKVKKRHTLQQTEPEPSWQARCSNFMMNLPVTLSDKLFGPRATCEASRDSERTICNDDSRLNRSQPIPKNTSKPSSRDQSNKKSVESRVSSLADHGWDKNTEADKVFVEKSSQVEPCYSRASQSFQDDVRCRRCLRKSEKSNVTREKINSKCTPYRKDDCARLNESANYSDVVHSRRSEPREPWSNCGARNRTSSSFSESKKRGKTSPRSSNWPAILSEKLFSPRNEKVMQCCAIDSKVKYEKVSDRDEDRLEISREVDSSLPATKKGRLLLKKYTISQTPETTEETLCFDIIPGAQLANTRSKLHSQICVKMFNDKEKKLETIQERSAELSSENLGKRVGAAKSRSPKPCLKSRGSAAKRSSRKTHPVEKKTSTEHIFFSNLIMKLLNKHGNVKEACNEKRCPRNTVDGRSRGKREQLEKKCALEHKTNTISRKYATTSIYKHRNKSIKRPRYIGNESGRREVVCGSSEQNMSPVCCTLDFPDVPGERKITRDFPSGKKKLLYRKSGQTFVAEDSLDENVKDLCEKVSQTMTNDRSSKFENESTREMECQGCESCGASKVRSFVEPGVEQVIDKRTYRQELKELCCSALHQRKREAKSEIRAGRCTKISSPKKCSCRVHGQNEIGYKSSQLACREFPQCLAEGMQRAFVIAGEDIRVKTLHDRETCTDDFPGSAHCRKTKSIAEHKPTLTTVGEEMNNGASESKKTERNSITKVIKNSEIKVSSRDSEVSYPQSTSPHDDPLPEQNGNTSTRKHPENAMRIRVDCEECVGSFCEDGACWVHPRGISASEDIRKAEQNVGKVFSPFSQEAHGERGSTVCGNETYLRTDLIESEAEKALGISKDADFCQRQSTAAASPSEGNDCSTSLVAAEARSDEKKVGCTDERSCQDQAVNDDFSESGKLDGEHARIGSPEKRSSWIKSRGTDLTVTIPEPRNIVNTCYSQRRSILPSRCEVRNNEYVKVKKGNVKRDGSVLEKSRTKARKPFQRIENVKQMECTRTLVIKDDESTERNTFEKDNRIVTRTTRCQYTRGGSVFDNDAKNHLVQNVTLADASFSKESVATPISDRVSSMQMLGEKCSVSHEMRIPPSKIPKKSRPLIKSQTPERVSLSATQALENSSVKLKKSSHESSSKKANSGTANSATDEKGTVREAEKFAQSAESEPSNRLTRSTDTCDGRDRERQKELKIPVYIFDNANTEVRILQVEMSSVKEQNITNSAGGQGTSRTTGVAEAGERRRSSKSSRLQSNGTRSGDGRNLNIASAKESKENKQTKEKRPKSEIASEKNGNYKPLPPLKLLTQIDSEIDTSSPTQEHVTMNADLFANPRTEEKYNNEIRRDLQSAAEENSNLNRTSTSTDEQLRRSGTATTRSESKVSKSSEGNKTDAKKTSKNNKSDEKSRNIEESTGKITKTAGITNADRTGNLARTLPASSHITSSDERATEDSGVDEIHVTGTSLTVGVHKPEACESTSCKRNVNHDRNVELRLTAENSDEATRIEKQSSRSCKRDLTNDNVEKNPTAEKGALPMKISIDEYSICPSGKEPSHERLSCKSRGSSCRREDRKPSLSSRTSSDSDEKKKQTALAEVLRPESPPCEDRSASYSSYAGESSTEAKNIKNQGIHCSVEEDTEIRSEKAITKIEDSAIPEAKSEKYTKSECNSVEFKRLCEGSLNSGTKTEEEIMQRNNVSEKLKIPCAPEKVISDSSDRNPCFTDDLKRFLNQGQEFLTSRRKKNCEQTASCSDGEQDRATCDRGKFNQNEARCKRSEFCKSVDYEKIDMSAKICVADQISNDSIPSLQKAYSTLKTILNRTKSIRKDLINAEQSKETQISAPIIDEPINSRKKYCITPRENAKSSESAEISEGNESPTVSISFGSSIFDNLNLRDYEKTKKKL